VWDRRERSKKLEDRSAFIGNVYFSPTMPRRSPTAGQSSSCQFQHSSHTRMCSSLRVLELIPPPGSPFSRSRSSGRVLPLRVPIFSKDCQCGGTPGYLLSAHFHIPCRRDNFVDNHHHLGLGPRNSTLGFRPLTLHPCQF
jgi:hypothetical protein